PAARDRAGRARSRPAAGAAQLQTSRHAGTAKRRARRSGCPVSRTARRFPEQSISRKRIRLIFVPRFRGRRTLCRRSRLSAGALSVRLGGDAVSRRQSFEQTLRGRLDPISGMIEPFCFTEERVWHVARPGLRRKLEKLADLSVPALRRQLSQISVIGGI